MRLRSGGRGGDPRDQTGAEGTPTPKLHKRSGRSGRPAADNQRVTAPQSLPSRPPSLLENLALPHWDLRGSSGSLRTGPRGEDARNLGGRRKLHFPAVRPRTRLGH